VRLPRPAPQHALTLAALRVVVPLVIVASPELREGPTWASMPAAMRSAPEGLGWFVAHLPIDASTARIVQVSCVFAALLTVFGVYTRARRSAVRPLTQRSRSSAIGIISGATDCDSSSM